MEEVSSLCAVLDAKLAQNILDMLLHGLGCDAQSFCDIAVAASLADPHEDFALARGQMLQVMLFCVS